MKLNRMILVKTVCIFKCHTNDIKLFNILINYTKQKEIKWIIKY